MLLRAILSHYRRHPMQLLALWAILTLATALWSGVWTLTDQARDSMQVGDRQLAGQQLLARQDGAEVTVEDFATLRRQGLCVVPWLEVVVGSGGARVIGVDPLAMSCADSARSGTAPALDGEPFVDIAEAAGLALKRPSRLRLYLARETDRLPEGWRRQPDPSALDTGELADSFLLNLNALAVLVVLVSALLIRSVYTLGLAQRRHGLQLLERYGVQRRRLRRYLLLELGVLALLGALPGHGLGLLLAEMLGAGFGAAMDNLFDTGLLQTSRSVTGFLVTLGVMTLVVAWCGLDLLKVRREQSFIPGWKPMAGFTMLVAGVVLVLVAGSLVVAFLATALLLAGAGLITPWLLQRLVLPHRDASPLHLWRRRELGVLMRRLALPLVALQLAAGTVIAVHALVHTFEGTFNQWLGQRLAGDLFVEVPDGKNISTVASVLSQGHLVDSWHPVERGQVALVDGDQTHILDLMATDTRSPLVREWSLLHASEAPWRAVRKGAVLVNEQLARRRGLAPGSRVSILVEGERRQVTVAGIYADYGRPSGEVLMDVAFLPSGYEPGFRSLTITLPASGNSRQASLVSALEQAWQVNGLQVRDNATVHRIANRIFRQTFTLTRAISYLTLGLAVVALLLTGWVVLGSRHWYYQLLTTWGLAGKAWFHVMLRLTTELMLVIWLAAVPTGIALTWVLVQRINPLAFGWSLPMAVYPGFWLELMALLALSALIVAGAFYLRAPSQVSAPDLATGEER
ncbi:ABC transporter permease [Marinobacter bryozoorum]|uniref:FtsX-like permease family protein n=1 Tax=Marinobacter bryozoorum TaxID=256324 RepID=UPI0020059547|nr:FtsX-like permease family protein [Marinobacter bryozoorum]MCK7544924.1 ABC transporter permease [Marinobacter bryozoorum]